jgi:hypothetical protein
MPLADDIRRLRDRARAELVAAHDYFTYSESAWDLVRDAAADPALAFRNRVTGSAASGRALARLARQYAARHVAEATFQQYLAVFEVFVGDLLRLWLAAYPRAIGGKTVTLADALDAGDLAELTRRLVDHEVAEVTYKSPRKVVEYLAHRIGLAPPPAADIDQLAEAKATRDVLAHNRGVVDAEHLKKAGPPARFAAGERIELPKPYHRRTWELLLKLVSGLADGAIAKAPA